MHFSQIGGCRRNEFLRPPPGSSTFLLPVLPPSIGCSKLFALFSACSDAMLGILLAPGTMTSYSAHRLWAHSSLHIVGASCRRIIVGASALVRILFPAHSSLHRVGSHLDVDGRRRRVPPANNVDGVDAHEEGERSRSGDQGDLPRLEDGGVRLGVDARGETQCEEGERNESSSSCVVG